MNLLDCKVGFYLQGYLFSFREKHLKNWRGMKEEEERRAGKCCYPKVTEACRNYPFPGIKQVDIVG